MSAALPRDALVAVIGAGAMGSGIAQVAAQAGHRVRLFDTRIGAAERARDAIGQALAGLAAKGRVDAGEASAAAARITPIHALPDCVGASLVVEAIVEDLEAKRALLRELELIVAPAAILASNTSSLSITSLAAGMKAPGRIVGMHFFNPVPLMQLVEVVSGLATDPAAAATVHATALAWGKTPVHVTSTPGFIVNRCARPYYGEALRLLAERAADAATLDALMRESGGFRMGPFELMDLIGNDVNFAVTRSVWEAHFHDPRYAPSLLQQERVTAGYLGRKSGRGFFDYTPGVERPAARSEAPAAPPVRVVVRGDAGCRVAAGRAPRRGRHRHRAQQRRSGISRRGAANARRVARALRRAHGNRAGRGRGQTEPRADRPRTGLRALHAARALPLPMAATRRRSRQPSARCRRQASRYHGSMTSRDSQFFAPWPCSPMKLRMR